jgi:NAD+ kinase
VFDWSVGVTSNVSAMPLRHIGLIVHRGRPEAVAAAEQVRSWAKDHDVVAIDMDVWSDDKHGSGRMSASAEARKAGHPELVVTIGGDGTFLRGVRVAAHDDVPVLGVDVGRVGFLTEVAPENITDALDAVYRGETTQDLRLLLSARASRHPQIPAEMRNFLSYGRGPLLPAPAGTDKDGGVLLDVAALNDVVIEKLVRDRQASVDVVFNDTTFASYSADALIVASPTGSTAYSFAAGGPIISPQVSGLIFTPVAPHMIFDRSVVLGAEETVTIRVLGHSGPVVISIDGQPRGVLDADDWISIAVAPKPARIVRLTPSHFYKRVRDKFSLGGAPAAIADRG